MFLGIESVDTNKLAAVDDSGERVTYGELRQRADTFAAAIPPRSLVFLLSSNTVSSLVAYVGCLSHRIVPLILSAKTDSALVETLIKIYKPFAVFMNGVKVSGSGQEASGFGFIVPGSGEMRNEERGARNEYPKLHPDLALLLPTSGSTGSPKLVRHSYRNIEANAENVKNLFGLTSDERAMAVLPMHYTMGLSVIASHLKAGATLILSGRSLLDAAFWKMLKDQRATSFTGVPYSYELLMKLRFTRMDLPDLKTITQGGGKLTPEMFAALADYAEKTGKRFIATYGQSECTARMAYLPAELALAKTCSIGFAEPGGQLSIVDEKGNETFEGEATGEMVYRGENVTLGYATCVEDLAKGDENHGVMHTGDLARRDADGCYFIVGRLKRFLKIFGLRIGLDEIESLIKAEFAADCVCSGTDQMLVVTVARKGIGEEIIDFIEQRTHLFRKNIQVNEVDAITRNEAGKVILHG